MAGCVELPESLPPVIGLKEKKRHMFLAIAVFGAYSKALGHICFFRQWIPHRMLCFFKPQFANHFKVIKFISIPEYALVLPFGFIV